MSKYKNGTWGPLEKQTEPYIPLHIGATCLHYGQECFEGLKAFRRKDGSVAMFRPDQNAQRLISSAQRLVMVGPPEELFIDAVKTAVRENIDFVPPYGTGATLYIRPLLIGTTPRVGLKASEEFLFIVLVTPVGPYYKEGFYPVRAYVQEHFDRAAPQGVGHIKAGGNYAAGYMGDLDGKKKGFPICLYLDSANHLFIDEFGTSNFFGIKPSGTYVTPRSTSILPGITNKSLITIAADFGMTVERRPIHISELENFSEIGACGTAAVITPVHSITWRDREYRFGKEKEAGETLTRFYLEIQGIQYGEREDRHGWMVGVE
jgi:branched-chain amino acid aminotransferase